MGEVDPEENSVGGLFATALWLSTGTMLALLVSTAALLCPLNTGIWQQSHARSPLRASIVRMGEDSTDTQAAESSWPAPAKSAADFQAEQAAAKETAEAKAVANPKPFQLEDGGFSPVAAATVAVFVIAGALFFQGISGGGISRFGDEQSPEVQACINKAATRDEASACLPPVPLT